MNEIISADKIRGYDEKGNLLYEVFFPLEEGYINITHTFVSDSLRGQGIARKLMEEVIAIAKKRNLPLKASCSYAKSYLEKQQSK